MLLAVTLPAVMAEWDKCKRANAVWAGVDQVLACCALLPVALSLRLLLDSSHAMAHQGFGVSEAHAVTYANGNVYIAGYACAHTPAPSSSSV